MALSKHAARPRPLQCRRMTDHNEKAHFCRRHRLRRLAPTVSGSRNNPQGVSAPYVIRGSHRLRVHHRPSAKVEIASKMNTAVSLR